MSATIEKSLYIGILKTRFDMFDEVTLILKNENKVSGTIEDLEYGYVTLKTENGYSTINVDHIEDYEIT